MLKNVIIPTIITTFSFVIGYVMNDLFFGSLILLCGLLNIWFANLNRNINYIFGSLFYLLNAYVSYINGLYGIAFLSLFIYFPLQIDGYIRWREDSVFKKLNCHSTIIIYLCFIFSSIGLSILLNLIPNQSLAILDATSNIANILGIILMNLRYKDAWYIWLLNNIIDLSIWVINTILNKPNAKMLLIVSIGYLILNICGIISSRNHKST